MTSPTIAVVGASRDRGKFGNKCVRAHAAAGYQVYPVHPKEEEIEGWPAFPTVADVPVEKLDRISIYIPPKLGITLLEDFQAVAARQVWFNPGSGSDAIGRRAREIGLEIIEGCSIVDIGARPMEYADE